MFSINWNKCYEWKVWGGTEWAGWVGGRQERPLHVHHIARPMDFSCGVSPKGHFVHRNLMFHSRWGDNMWYLSLSPNSLALGGQKLEGWWMGGGRVWRRYFFTYDPQRTISEHHNLQGLLPTADNRPYFSALEREPFSVWENITNRGIVPWSELITE